MSINLGSLPPPFPNAAISLSKVASNVQLREAIEQSSENKPIQTGIYSGEVVKSVGTAAEISSDSTGDNNTPSQDTQDAGSKLDLSV